jgi:hypothetical protein
MVSQEDPGVGQYFLYGISFAAGFKMIVWIDEITGDKRIPDYF